MAVTLAVTLRVRLRRGFALPLPILLLPLSLVLFLLFLLLLPDAGADAPVRGLATSPPRLEEVRLLGLLSIVPPRVGDDEGTVLAVLLRVKERVIARATLRFRGEVLACLDLDLDRGSRGGENFAACST